MSHGGRRNGAGRPKHRTVLEVALSLSAPADWTASEPESRDSGSDIPVSAKYRPSKASAIRSSIPAAAIRRQEIEVSSGRGRRSIMEIEAELVETTHASAGDPDTGQRWGDEDGFEAGFLHSVFTPQVKGHSEPGSSMNDFLYEDFYDGTRQPTELRGLKWEC